MGPDGLPVHFLEELHDDGGSEGSLCDESMEASMLLDFIENEKERFAKVHTPNAQSSSPGSTKDTTEGQGAKVTGSEGLTARDAGAAPSETPPTQSPASETTAASPTASSPSVSPRSEKAASSPSEKTASSPSVSLPSASPPSEKAVTPPSEKAAGKTRARAATTGTAKDVRDGSTKYGISAQLKKLAANTPKPPPVSSYGVAPLPPPGSLSKQVKLAGSASCSSPRGNPSSPRGSIVDSAVNTKSVENNLVVELSPFQISAKRPNLCRRSSSYTVGTTTPTSNNSEKKTLENYDAVVEENKVLISRLEASGQALVALQSDKRQLMQQTRALRHEVARLRDEKVDRRSPPPTPDVSKTTLTRLYADRDSLSQSASDLRKLVSDADVLRLQDAQKLSEKKKDLEAARTKIVELQKSVLYFERQAAERNISNDNACTAQAPPPPSPCASADKRVVPLFEMLVDTFGRELGMDVAGPGREANLQWMNVKYSFQKQLLAGVPLSILRTELDELLTDRRQKMSKS